MRQNSFLGKRTGTKKPQLQDGYKLTHESDPDVGVADEAQGQEVLHEVESENVPAKDQIWSGNGTDE